MRHWLAIQLATLDASSTGNHGCQFNLLLWLPVQQQHWLPVRPATLAANSTGYSHYQFNNEFVLSLHAHLQKKTLRHRSDAHQNHRNNLHHRRRQTKRQHHHNQWRRRRVAKSGDVRFTHILDRRNKRGVPGLWPPPPRQVLKNVFEILHLLAKFDYSQKIVPFTQNVVFSSKST